MRIEVVATPSRSYENIVKDLEKRISGDVDPKLLLVFFTESVWDCYERVLEYLKSRYPDARMAGCFIEGYCTPRDSWMRGLVLMLIDAEGVEVFHAKGRKASDTFGRLGEVVGGGWSSVILIYPAFYFTNRYDMSKVGLRDRVYSMVYGRLRGLEKKRGILRRYSRFLESKYIYPIDKALRSFGGEAPVVSMNLMPMEAKCETPVVLADYERIGRGAVAVCFKGKTNTVFHDVHPERGNSFEETLEILKGCYPNVEEVNVVKGGVVIGEIDGMAPVKFLESKVRAYRVMGQEVVLDKLVKGKLQTVTPYGLAFVSRETYGASMLGLMSYPVNLYPSIFTLEDFYDKCLFLGEFYKDGFRRYMELFDKKKFDDSFDIIMIDHNVIPMFGKRIHTIMKQIKDFSNEFLLLITSFPSCRKTSENRRYLSQVYDDTFINLTGTSAMIEIKELR